MPNTLISPSQLMREANALQNQTQAQEANMESKFQPCWLYHESCRDGRLFENEVAYGAAIEEGWSDSPVGLPETPAAAPVSTDTGVAMDDAGIAALDVLRARYDTDDDSQAVQQAVAELVAQSPAPAEDGLTELGGGWYEVKVGERIEKVRGPEAATEMLEALQSSAKAEAEQE